MKEKVSKNCEHQKGRQNWGCEQQIASSINCHNALAFQLSLIFLFFHLLPKPFCLVFFVTLLAFVFSPPTKTPLFEFFLVKGCELLTSSMSFSSLVMNDIDLSPNEKMVPIFANHDSNFVVDNLP